MNISTSRKDCSLFIVCGIGSTGIDASITCSNTRSFADIMRGCFTIGGYARHRQDDLASEGNLGRCKFNGNSQTSSACEPLVKAWRCC